MLKEHKPIYDDVVNRFILDRLSNLTANDLTLGLWSTGKHIDIFTLWIQNSQHRQIIGLSDFSYRALCNGTSQAIEAFVNRNQNRRLRFSQSEFVLAKIVCNANGVLWQWLEDGELEANDAVVISCPFSGNGGSIDRFDETMIDCQRLSIPVLIDAAYFGISTGIKIDVTSPCITDVCVSISKPFSTMLRHGIRFTRNYHDDFIQSSSDMGIVARPCISVASQVLCKFDSDYIVNKYLARYRNVCVDHSLEQTHTITLALGSPDKFPNFKRGGCTRVCVTDEVLE